MPHEHGRTTHSISPEFELVVGEHDGTSSGREVHVELVMGHGTSSSVPHAQTIAERRATYTRSRTSSRRSERRHWRSSSRSWRYVRSFSFRTSFSNAMYPSRSFFVSSSCRVRVPSRMCVHSAHSGWSRSVRLDSKLKRRNEDRRWCERGEGFGCGGSSGAGAGGTAAVALRDLENDGFLGCGGEVVGRF